MGRTVWALAFAAADSAVMKTFSLLTRVIGAAVSAYQQIALYSVVCLFLVTFKNNNESDNLLHQQQRIDLLCRGKWQ